MLNAFRHQRFNTATAPFSKTSMNSAQRLSASEIQHINALSNGLASLLVLNAFRHQRFNTRCRLVFSLYPIVLNAFRHQRFNTTRRSLKYLLNQLVLNAFRHQRFNTSSQLRFCCDSQCAQRLSASEIQHSPNRMRCSTVSCAQRLSASEIQHNLAITRTRWTQCAQRLSASEIQHRFLRMAIAFSLVVLNAFRHQRFNTLSRAARCSAKACAQRLSASEIQHIMPPR